MVELDSDGDEFYFKCFFCRDNDHCFGPEGLLAHLMKRDVGMLGRIMVVDHTASQWSSLCLGDRIMSNRRGLRARWIFTWQHLHSISYLTDLHGKSLFLLTISHSFFLTTWQSVHIFHTSSLRFLFYFSHVLWDVWLILLQKKKRGKSICSLFLTSRSHCWNLHPDGRISV